MVGRVQASRACCIILQTPHAIDLIYFLNNTPGMYEINIQSIRLVPAIFAY